MRFWDSSAIVPLLVREEGTGRLLRLLRRDAEMLVWWSSGVECVSALCRLEREGQLSRSAMTSALGRLDELAASWIEIEPGQSIRETARRLLRVHALRAADALQLAAAILASEGQPSTLPLVCLDPRLSEAADREGFTLTDGNELPPE
jgi:uncharacterized protein